MAVRRFPHDWGGRTRADAEADPQALPRAAGDERAAEPRRADLLRPREEGVPDGADEPPWRRALRNLVRGSVGDAAAARRRRPRAVLRSAVRRSPRLARRSARG